MVMCSMKLQTGFMLDCWQGGLKHITSKDASFKKLANCAFVKLYSRLISFLLQKNSYASPGFWKIISNSSKSI